MTLVKRDTAKQYGTRYGPKNRDKVRLVEKQYRKALKCPTCSKSTVKRQAAGIFLCSHCNSKFAARAYSIDSSKKQIEELDNGGI